MILSEFESDSSWSSRLAEEEQVGQHMRTWLLSNAVNHLYFCLYHQ